MVVAGIPGTAPCTLGGLDTDLGDRGHDRVVFNIGIVTGLTVQPGGGIVTVGYSTTGATSDALVSRFHADGTPDRDFGVVRLPSRADADEQARAAVAQPDGKIVVVGNVTDVGGLNDFGVWRLEPSGAMDSSFGTNGLIQFGDDATDDVAYDVGLDPQNRILVAGVRATADGGDLTLLRLTSTGAPDPTFNAGIPFLVLRHPGIDYVRAMAVQPDGRIVVAGNYQRAAGIVVLRISPGTATSPASLDDRFGDAGVAEVLGSSTSLDTGVAVTPDGHILVLDQVPSISGRTLDATVVRLTRAGVVDPTFGSASGARIAIPGTFTFPEALALLPDGGVSVVGSNGQVSFVARFHSTGMPDLRLGPGGVRTLGEAENLVAVAALADGHIITVGNMPTRNVVYRL